MRSPCFVFVIPFLFWFRAGNRDTKSFKKSAFFLCTSSEIIAVAEFGLYHVVQRVKNSAGAVVIRRQAITRFTSFEVFSQPRSDDHFNRGH